MYCPICFDLLYQSTWSKTYMCRKSTHIFDYSVSLDEWYLYLTHNRIEAGPTFIIYKGKTIVDFQSMVDCCQILELINKYLKIKAFL